MTAFIRLHASAVRFVLPHIGTDDTRPTLQCLHLDASGVLVATDGTTLGAWGSATTDGPNGEKIAHGPLCFTLGRKVPQWVDYVDIPLPTDDVTHGRAVAPGVLVGKKGKTESTLVTFLPGPFPYWRNAVPQTLDPSCPLPPVNPAMLARLDVDGKGDVTLTASRTTGPVVATFTRFPDAFALVMPLNSKMMTAPREIPAWGRA